MSESLDIGVDVDSRTLVPAAYGRGSGDRFRNAAPGIRKWLATLPPRCRIGMEATGNYFRLLASLAQQAGHTVFVINPRLIHQYAKATNSRGKTDAMDAEVIARYVKKEGDELREYVPRTEAQEQLHQLLRKRQTLIRVRMQLEQSFEVKKRKGSELEELLNCFAAKLASLEEQIRKLVVEGEQAALYQRLQTIPGIGATVAAHLTYHLTRWPLANSNAWIACSGLDPRPNESGSRTGRRRLSKRGDPSLRQILYMAAMGLTRCKRGRPLYDELIKRGHPSTGAFNILARKLARIAWGVFKSGRDFDPQLLGLGEIKFAEA